MEKPKTMSDVWDIYQDIKESKEIMELLKKARKEGKVKRIVIHVNGSKTKDKEE